jgi:methylated-DNA-[protein]-cysteine S-methyltransferase
MKTMSQFIATFPICFGSMTIVWQDAHAPLLITHIFLTTPKGPSSQRAQNMFPDAIKGTNPVIEDLIGAIQFFTDGNDIEFDLTLLDWSQCSEMQQQVLRTEAGIPRGYVSTYKRIAEHIGLGHGARAVGNALARNPFPIVIPCHRAVKTDGSLGGYQGGITMKRALLETEGVQFHASGKVVMKKVYY